MPFLDLGADYTDGQTATADIFNDKFNAIEELLNVTKLDADNIQTGSLTSDLFDPASSVSALPGSPVDGQVIHYQNAAMVTAGTMWAFRYNASASGSYKWQFVGGPPLRDFNHGDAANMSTTSYTAVSSPPSVTLPLGGDYFIEHNGLVRRVNTPNGFAYSTVSINGVAQSGGTVPATTEGLECITVPQIALSADFYHGSDRKNSLTAGHAVSTLHKVAAGSCIFGRREVSVMPVRVG